MQQFDLVNVRVLELGCGSGQAGVGAAAQRAKVTMTDAVGLALMVAKLNAWELRDRISFRRVRWNQDQLAQEPFPILIGSDIVYDPNLFPLLNLCARQHLATGGRMYLSEPHRHTGDRFSSWIRAAGGNRKSTISICVMDAFQFAFSNVGFRQRVSERLLAKLRVAIFAASRFVYRKCSSLLNFHQHECHASILACRNDEDKPAIRRQGFARRCTELLCCCTV